MNCGSKNCNSESVTMRNFLRLARRHLHNRVISKETIKPSSPTPPHLKTYNLSLVDQISPPIHIPFVFFYPNYGSSNIVTTHCHQERLATSQLLKKSLSQTLSRYYPFSGRLTTENRSYVDCNDEGVEFVEAQIDTTLSELIHVHSLENQPLDQFFPTDGVCGRPTYKGDSSHLVMVQLSYFACGGFALAVSMSHKIADGCTFCSFVNHWAAVTRQNSGDPHAQPLSPHFIYSPNDIANIPEYVIDKGNNLVTKKFVFPNSKLAELKAKAKDHKNASAGEEAMMNPTRIEVLSSLLYGCAVKAAKKTNSQSVDSFNYAQVVNLRNRMVNPLPETAVGNIYLHFIIPTVTENELGLSHLTSRVKKAKMQITGLSSSLVKQHLRQTFDEAFTKSASNKVVEIYGFTSICRFPLYQVDFGWGKPVRVSISPGLVGKNMSILMDTAGGDGIEVMLTLEEENMAVFQNDEQLLAFAF